MTQFAKTEQTIALAVITTRKWRPERMHAFGRLWDSIQGIPAGVQYTAIEGDGPEHCSVWSNKAWTWAISTGADRFLLIQEDALLAPRFWPKFRAMIEAVPDEVIGFQAIHPVTPALAKLGCNWYATQDMIPGVAWSCPMTILARFTDWKSGLREGADHRMNEDGLFGLFCAANRIPILHPIPTLVDHDSTLPSLVGHDQHTHRNPLVTWRAVTEDGDGLSGLEDARYWAPRNPLIKSGSEAEKAMQVPYLGRFYDATPYNYVRFVRDWTEEDADRIERDMVRFSQVPPSVPGGPAVKSVSVEVVDRVDG